MLKDFITEFIPLLVLIIFVLFVLFVSIVAIVIGCNGIDYLLNKSSCNVYVANQLVYNGRCHFLTITSIGENGNTKKLFINEDIWKLKPSKIYVNEDIVITDSN